MHVKDGLSVRGEVDRRFSQGAVARTQDGLLRESNCWVSYGATAVDHPLLGLGGWLSTGCSLCKLSSLVLHSATISLKILL